MIIARDAINIANRELVGSFNAQDVQVEEYMMDRSRPFWLITLSYSVLSTDPNSIANLIPVRKWKTVTVDGVTGAVESVLAGGLAELPK